VSPCLPRGECSLLDNIAEEARFLVATHKHAHTHCQGSGTLFVNRLPQIQRG